MQNPTLRQSLALLLLGLPLAFSPAYAGSDGDHCTGKHQQAMQERLNLTDEQAASMKQLKEQHWQQHKALFEKYGLKKGEGHPKKQLSDDQFKNFKEEKQALHKTHESEVAGILNEEQFNEWKELRKEKWHKHKGQHKEKRKEKSQS